MMANVIIIMILVVIAIVAVKSYMKKLAHGCCGGGGDAPCRIKVADKNKNNYPYTTLLKIEGMSCQNCAVRIENALNGLQGVWAQVNLANKQAVVRMKQPVEEQELCSLVAKAGYLAEVEENQK